MTVSRGDPSQDNQATANNDLVKLSTIILTTTGWITLYEDMWLRGFAIHTWYGGTDLAQ